MQVPWIGVDPGVAPVFAQAADPDDEPGRASLLEVRPVSGGRGRRERAWPEDLPDRSLCLRRIA